MKRRVLIVDDEPSILSTVCAILKAYGYDAVGVSSGYEAIAKVAGFCPDLLLSDIMMPGMNGFATGVEIKKLCPDCRLLFFSGYYDLSDMAEDLKKRGHRFEVLFKPMQPALLIEKIKARLAEES